jgi:hypothetical protein
MGVPPQLVRYYEHPWTLEMWSVDWSLRVSLRLLPPSHTKGSALLSANMTGRLVWLHGSLWDN